YAARELDNLTLALYLRRSWLQYQSIVQTRRSYGHDTETTSLPPRHFPTGYFELGGAIRLGQGPWQAILDLYVSGPTKKVTPDPDQINFATGSLTVMTIGVVLRPHLLAQAAKPSPATP
ncbi:MAG TPA: hypothetical protein VEI97_18350, partial [bacterium]|nr:hypothetical protein [bacterium]